MVQPAVFNQRFDWFAEQMKFKMGLPKNVAKGDWLKLPDLYYLVERLEEEVMELKSSIVNNESYRNVIMESADVGNFAMMIADWCNNRDSHPELG